MKTRNSHAWRDNVCQKCGMRRKSAQASWTDYTYADGSPVPTERRKVPPCTAHVVHINQTRAQQLRPLDVHW